MKNWDYYETIGIITPGMLFIVAIAMTLAPTKLDLISRLSSVSVGSLGIGIVISYVAGQLLQSIGNFLAMIFWVCWGGMPTDWVRSGKHALISSEQRAKILESLRKTLGSRFELTALTSKKDWYSITRQLYSAVSQKGRSKRIDVFNGNYGLCRGIASASLVVLLLAMLHPEANFTSIMILASCLLLSLQRMYNFGVLYGRELMVEYISVVEMASKTRKLANRRIQNKTSLSRS